MYGPRQKFVNLIASDTRVSSVDCLSEVFLKGYSKMSSQCQASDCGLVGPVGQLEVSNSAQLHMPALFID